ncbi:hypothetical protein [Acinetobacter chinensis]|jgi:hypothetical protein|uniref:hypothetical protein n=1 Tax=Acinetobacter chinensis TaxID=2004650 RepID=UPI00293451B4|nr:hypothetical protein [Acinetobacter chinensis]WOE43061.1 hypothetical protein QSG87_08080 [Acinetobacter chinensis]
MKNSAKSKQDMDATQVRKEIHIGLLQPVKIYSAKELAAMPLSQMIQCRNAQEEYYVKSELSLSDQVRQVKESMQAGEVIIITFEEKRIHTYAVFKLAGQILSKRIINQLTHRGLIKLPDMEGVANA